MGKVEGDWKGWVEGGYLDGFKEYRIDGYNFTVFRKGGMSPPPWALTEGRN